MLNLGQPKNEIKRAMPLALLKLADDAEIHGITRFQKLVFLLQEGELLEKESLDDSEAFEFKPHNYGPYSKELHDWLDELVNQDLLEREKKRTPAGNQKEVYRWSDDGSSTLSDSDILNDEELVHRIEETLEKFNSMPLLELLDEVYEEYPDYTTNSVL